MSKNSFSAFCISGTNSGCGKTTVSIALIAALSQRGFKVAPFKCGPDYIDTSYLKEAAKAEAINLDTWMMGDEGVKSSFYRNSKHSDIAVLEGVMGLFDGARVNSLEGSTAGCAKILGIPVILVVNAGGSAGSIAALVSGFKNFSKDINVSGVIANNVGGSSHERIIHEALKNHGLPPLLGTLPKNKNFAIPERHLGLKPFCENTKREEWFEMLAVTAEKNFDINRIIENSRLEKNEFKENPYPKPSQKIALARDEAFNFYYPDNIHHLRMAGFEFVEFSPLRDTRLPDGTDVVYIGGGFPEVFASQLADNCEIRRTIKDFAEAGGKIYAECGGMMFLCRSLRNSQGIEFPMCGVLPAKTHMGDQKSALGYREVETIYPLPFCNAGTIIRGHEFHWSEISLERELPSLYKCRDSKGNVWKTGISLGSVSASYIHLSLTKEQISA
ncbi:MAG TPA: cobyrinate a,c-diamide synthase [Victivallales bacterium]|nr:cobyrinate a,c-diamide synthase [Victivallales bacterium]